MTTEEILHQLAERLGVPVDVLTNDSVNHWSVFTDAIRATDDAVACIDNLAALWGVESR